MTQDVMVIAWKELREFLHTGSRVARFGLIIAVAAAWATIYLTVFDEGAEGALFFLSYGTALLMVLFMSTSGTDVFAGERERRTLEALLSTRIRAASVLGGKLLFLIAAAAAIGLASFALGAGILAVLAGGRVPWHSFPELGSSALLGGLTVGTLFATVGSIVSAFVRTVRQANAVMALMMLPLFMLFFSVGSSLRDNTAGDLPGSAVWSFLAVTVTADIALVAAALLLANRRIVLRAW